MSNWWIGLGLAALLGAGAFWDGLYSPGQQLAGTAVMAVLVVLAGAAGGVTSRTAGYGEDLAGETATGLGAWERVLLALFGGAVLGSLGSPVAAGTAAHGPVVAAGWLLAFWLGRHYAAVGWVERLLCWLWALLGPVILFGGLAALSYLPVHHSGRLASFLGYPIAVGVLGLLGLAGTLPLLQEGRTWAPLLAWANGLAVLLSGSRGVWAVGLVLAGYLFWADRRLLRPVWWPLVAALAAALWIGPAVAERTVLAAAAQAQTVAQAPVTELLAFGCIGLTVLAAGWFRHRWVLAGGVAAWLAAAALSPGWGWLLGRAAALPLTEGSSVERMTFLADGLRLAGAWPWGAGYRAWTALQLQGASYAYYSAEVHSAALDLTLAFGWVGGLAFLALLGRFLLGLRAGRGWSPWRLAGLAGLGALGLHALLDWDLSYGLFALPLWLGFGLGGAGGGVRRRPLGRGAAAAVAGLAAAGALILGAGDVAAWLAGRAEPAAAARHGALGVALAPWNDLAHAQYGRALSALGRRDEALAQFAEARRLGPREPWYAELAARELLQARRPREAAEAYRDFVRLWPWYIPAYESALSAHSDMLFRAEVTRDEETAAQVIASARAILEQLDRQKAKEPPGRPRRPMAVNTPVIEQARATFAP